MTSVIPLSTLRTQIDTLDEQLLQLLNQRANLALEVAKTKLAAGEQGSFYRPDREALVLRRIQALNTGPLADITIARFFRELMSACLALEKPLDIAFLGPEGTFTQQAAYKHFGSAVNTIPAASITDIFSAVENEQCQFGVVPVENSTEGVINHTLDRFMASPLKICGEVEVRVHHNLMASFDQREHITDIYAHQQSLAQCRLWLDKHLPHANRIPVSSNAEAAKLVVGSINKAAIASQTAAELYNLILIDQNIEDEPNNTTRFIIIGQQLSTSTGLDKTSLLISVGNQPGALYKILAPFAEYGIGLLHIESRPSRQGLWEYVFFIDIEGHCEDKPVAKALDTLKCHVNMLKILGAYPRAVIT